MIKSSKCAHILHKLPDTGIQNITMHNFRPSRLVKRPPEAFESSRVSGMDGRMQTLLRPSVL